MREIKFRGLTVDGREWVYGNLLLWPNRDAFICPPDNSGALYKTWVDERSIGQFTGLKDKNGVEIYDGDVLLHFGRFKRICEYQDGAFGYKADLDFGFISYNSNAYNLGLAESVITKAEVIGNIYQNPELLKD